MPDPSQGDDAPVNVGPLPLQRDLLVPVITRRLVHPGTLGR